MSYRHPSTQRVTVPRRATRDRQLHRKRGNVQLSRYRAKNRIYAEGMPHVGDSNTEAATRENFAVWVEAVLSAQKAKGVPKVKVAELADLNRNTIDRWINKEKFPSPEALRKFCDALDLEYAEPARILGWGSGLPSLTDTAKLGEFIRRARGLAEEEGTSEKRRRTIEALIQIAEEARRSAASQRLSAGQTERRAEALLKEILDEGEDATDR
jgi:transcriptional regulator with XRE-family HTH domain